MNWAGTTPPRTSTLIHDPQALLQQADARLASQHKQERDQILKELKRSHEKAAALRLQQVTSACMLIHVCNWV